YGYYGGRGIRVCGRWLERNGFANFLADVGRQPGPQASLNRVDNDGDYDPGNVRWSTPAEQARNRRSKRRITFGGRTGAMVEWAEELGINPVTRAQRLWNGWPVERALTEPVAPRKPSNDRVRRKAIQSGRGPEPRGCTAATARCHGGNHFYSQAGP